MFSCFRQSMTLPLVGAMVALGAGCQVAAAPGARGSHVHAQATDRPAVHGMLVVGDGTVYASHLPMFHRPHDYQGIAEIGFLAKGSDALATYRQDRVRTKTRVYTLVPAPGVLSEMMQPGRQFPADLYRGHFERGGVPILTGLTVTVKQVVQFRKFTRAPQPARLEYLLFGRGADVFAAHRIAAAPDFDQVLAITPEESLSPAALASGIAVTLPHRGQAKPLEAGETVAATALMGPLSFRVQTEIYHETGDLAH